jgi:hypothetical protein
MMCILVVVLSGGNPFKMLNQSDEERDRVCDRYAERFFYTSLSYYLHELKGKRLGCYCKPKRCHGDFLANLADDLGVVESKDK